MLDRMHIARLLELSSEEFQPIEHVMRIRCIRSLVEKKDSFASAQLLTVNVDKGSSYSDKLKVWDSFVRDAATRLGFAGHENKSIQVWHRGLQAEVRDIDSLRDGDCVVISVPELADGGGGGGGGGDGGEEKLEEKERETVGAEAAVAANKQDNKSKGKGLAVIGGSVVDNKAKESKEQDPSSSLSAKAAGLLQLIDAIKHGRSLFGVRLSSVKHAFRTMDRKATGTVTIDQFLRALKRLDATMTKDQIKMLMTAAGKDPKDGLIKYADLLDILRVCGHEDALPGEESGRESEGRRINDSTGRQMGWRKERKNSLQRPTLYSPHSLRHLRSARNKVEGQSRGRTGREALFRYCRDGRVQERDARDPRARWWSQGLSVRLFLRSKQ